MSRLRAIRLVAMREIIERGRSRGYVLSLVFTRVPAARAGSSCRRSCWATTSRRASRSWASTPAGLEATLLAVAGAATSWRSTISTVPDRAAAEAGLEDETIDAALLVPADLSAPGELLVAEEAGGQLQAVVTQRS